jgi:hypothetical protein
MADNGIWTTENEIAFIHGLGRYKWRPRKDPETGRVMPKYKFSRRKMLDRYLRSCKRRVDWGDMDRLSVIEAAELALANACR